MDNIRKAIEIIFKKESPDRCIKNYYKAYGKNYVDLLEKDHFLGHFSFDNKNLYNTDEIENICRLIRTNWMVSKNNENKKSLFNILTTFTDHVLLEENDEPLCEYKNLLRWRELSFQLGEDILTTSYLANKDFNIGREKRSKFTWKTVIGTNNTKIRTLLKKGVAENHFHLNGSSANFDISWVSLMNNLKNRKSQFNKLKERLKPKVEVSFSSERDDLYILVKKAAAIRAFLSEKYILKKSSSEDLSKEHKILKNILLSETALEIGIYTGELEGKIETLKELHGKKFGREIPDYLIDKNVSINNYNIKDKRYNGKIIFYGERKFLYEIFKIIYSGGDNIKNYEDLFYIYLLIKNKLRDEILQINGLVGFGNFGKYQDRKTYFIPENTIYDVAIANIAINGSIIDQEIKYLEARITPKASLGALKESIKYYEKNISDYRFYDYRENIHRYLEGNRISSNEDKKHFYTLHFIKNKDREENLQGDISMFNPRNKIVREIYKREARAINNLRKSSSKYGELVYGIDAANVEVGCRPEVFGQVYRYLKNYTYENPLNNFIDSENIKNNFKVLGRTYHVGEEFLDIVDGLRAIDEVIKFLDFTHGDRLGHGLALGISSKDYYRSKNGIIVLSKQDFIDNIIWLFNKIKEYNITLSSRLKEELRNCYKKYSREIYNEIYDERDYYESWLLRGDAPELYLDELYLENKDGIHNYSFMDKSGINDREECNEARKNTIAKKIYRNYHYSKRVKERGAKSIEYKISEEYIEVVNRLQKALQGEVRDRNIYIETNPTSNYLIGTFKRYGDHPILQFYNLPLGKDIDTCCQISVSINTDDQGIFGTLIENEYSLMALALEKEKDRDGNPLYNQNMIYEWLDKIREMGIEQSFKERIDKGI